MKEDNMFFIEDAISDEDTDEAFEKEYGESLCDENGIIKDKFAAGYIDKSPEAIAKRRAAAEYAKASVGLEGMLFDEKNVYDIKFEKIIEDFINGSITNEKKVELVMENIRRRRASEG